MKTIFKEGKPQSISDVLLNKDHRNALQNKLMETYPNDTIITIKLNIPGPIKNNAALQRLFNTGASKFVPAFQPLKKLTLNSDAGPELLLVTKMDAKAVKQQAIEFEDQLNYGRLFDIDVLNQADGHYSRVELGMQSRKCLICHENAKECARSRKHSVAELQNKISEIYDEEING
ncbi:citrate lyase holo-[acyl-carrier protein] synthase [Fructilactobacillus frigidiflavus]|uniref:citrate lyase holo-[acyl-carrier protein] synthase n=1 Tax=Fructilactobacillus frigidiflavus TaxID=3242688 RepID=UPI003756F959